MQKIINYFRQYIGVISIVLAMSILLTYSLSYFMVNTGNKRAAEMYVGELQYSMTIDDVSTNTLSVPSGETIVDVDITNKNGVDTYFKLLYLKNSNVTISYYDKTKDTSEVYTKYLSSGDLIEKSLTGTLKLKIINNSSSTQTLTFSVSGGYSTNKLSDVEVPSTYSEITTMETISSNTYFCKTSDTLTQGLQYVNGQYTYAYKQEGSFPSSGLAWSNISGNGWGVQLTNKASTDAVTSNVCSYINNKPIVAMSYMFYISQATSIDVSSFNTSKVINMDSMFYSSKVTSLNLGNFDTSNVTNMRQMFIFCEATIINVSSFDTSKVTNMNGMFKYIPVSSLNISSFDTSKVTDMGSMFANMENLTALDLSNFNTSKVTSMYSMFSHTVVINLDLSSFDTSNVTNMNRMFEYGTMSSVNLSSFNTSKVTNMSNMFENSKIENLDLSSFDTTNVTTMRSMFANTELTIIDLSNFDTSKVTDMTGMFDSSKNLKTIYVSEKFSTNKVTLSNKMFNGCTNLVGGNGTSYSSSYIDKTYARVDRGTSSPGYFTEMTLFFKSSWETIVANVKAGNIDDYKLGDTKTVDMGSYGVHTLRIANLSTPSECSTSNFSQTACGFVLEFVDVITTHNMNPSGTYKGTSYSLGWNVDGWPASSMYTFVNTDIYNALPNDLKSSIINTTVISSHGSKDSSNFTSIDKLYLLSSAEVWAGGHTSDTSKDVTRQLDYYKSLETSTSNYSGSIKKNGNSVSSWWLRSSYSSSGFLFYYVYGTGNYSSGGAYTAYGVSPAFRIG